MCSSPSASSFSVFTSRGCLWPRTFTAMPPRRSQYSFPFASTSFAPLPLRGWNGVRAYVPRTNALSRASTADGDSSCSNKAGSSVLTDGDLIHAVLEGVQCGLQLRLHAAGNDVNPLLDGVGLQRRNDGAVLVE